MKKCRMRTSVWIPCAAAAAAPWIALIVQYSAPLLIAAIVVTAAAVAAVVWTFCADRAQAAQAELYWHALAPELPDPPPQSPADWLTQLGQRAAAQAEAADAERRTTAQFLSGWSAQVTAAVTELSAAAARVQQTQPAEGRLLTQECNTLRCRAAQLMNISTANRTAPCAASSRWSCRACLATRFFTIRRNCARAASACAAA